MAGFYLATCGWRLCISAATAEEKGTSIKYQISIVQGTRVHEMRLCGVGIVIADELSPQSKMQQLSLRLL